MAKKRTFACDRCDRRYHSEDGVRSHKIRLSHDCTCYACHHPQTYPSFATWLVHIEMGKCPVLSSLKELFLELLHHDAKWATCWVWKQDKPVPLKDRFSCFQCPVCQARYTKLSKFWKHVEDAQHCHSLLAPSHNLDVLKDRIQFYCRLNRIVYLLRVRDWNGICSVVGTLDHLCEIWTQLNLPSFTFGTDEMIYHTVACQHSLIGVLRSWREDLLTDSAHTSASGTPPKSRPGQGPAQLSQGAQPNEANAVTQGPPKTRQKKKKKKKKNTKSADQGVDSGQTANARRDTLTPSHVRDSTAMPHANSKNISLIPSAWHSLSGLSQDEDCNPQELAHPGVNANDLQRVHETHRVNSESNLVPSRSGRCQIQQPNTRTQQVDERRTTQASTTPRATSATTPVPTGGSQGHIEPST
ncbi:hypothetical protein KEM56_006538, partial [Ascosphaera pollenicola]